MITWRVFRELLISSLAVLCCMGYRCSAQFLRFQEPLVNNPFVQVEGNGLVYVGATKVLSRLNGNLVLEESFNLTSRVIALSLSPGGERLMVCTADLTCEIFNAANFLAQRIDTDLMLVSAENIIAFSTEGSFYTGSYGEIGDTSARIFRLSQCIYGDGSGIIVRSTDYAVERSSFVRNFIDGFVRGEFAYYVVYDTRPSPDLRVLRVCHVTGCPGNNSSTCEFEALYEEDVSCGGPTAVTNDGGCGVSVLDEFGGASGPSLVLSRCRPGTPANNLVCSYNFTNVNNIMDERFEGCRLGRIEETDPAWASGTKCIAVSVSQY